VKETPDDEKDEAAEDLPAERYREFIEQRFPEGVAYSPLPEEDARALDKEVSQGEVAQGDIADRKPAPNTTDRTAETQSADTQNADKNSAAAQPAGAAPGEQGSGGDDFDLLDAADDHPAERLREFIEQRFPEGIETSPLPEQADDAKSSHSQACPESENMAGTTTDSDHECQEEVGQDGVDDDKQRDE